MASWWSRLFGKAPAPAPAPEAAPWMAQPIQPPSPLPSFGARRPLISPSGEIAGFEFRLADSVELRLQARGDLTAQAAYAATLLSAMRSTIQSGRVAMASVAAAVLVRPSVLKHVEAGAMILAANPLVDDHEQSEGIHRLRARGVRIGAADEGEETPTLPDFVVLRSEDGSIDALIASAQRWRASHPGITLIAIDIDSIDDLERALHEGISLAAGRLDRVGAPREQQTMQPAVQRICQLLNYLVVDHDNVRISEGLRADVPLSYRLLRYVNSPALGLSRGIDSIEQAVMLLGRTELYRWLSVLLLAMADGRKTSRALQETALARARLLEMLAGEKGTDPPAALFTVGLLSLLDVMLQLPLATALEPLRLSDSAKEALLDKTGPWHVYLLMAAALEHHDMPAANELAGQFGGLERVLHFSDDAWKWSSNVYAQMRS